MPPIDQAVIDIFVQAGANAANTAEQGKAMEDMISHLFGLVPGIIIQQRNAMNAFHTEEIDIALWNEREAAGFAFLPNIILVECKNWSARVSSSEVSWFDAKLRSRGLEYGILIAAKGITGDPAELTAAHSIVARALTESRKLIVISTDEIRQLADTEALVHLIKQKICTLHVQGTLG